MGNETAITNNGLTVQYSQNGQKTVAETGKQNEDSNVSVWDDNNEQTQNEEQKETKSNKNSDSKHKGYTNLSNPVNRAYTSFLKSENSFLDSDFSTDLSSGVSNSTILSTGRIVETMETIDDAGTRHLSFLSEDAPENNNISGSMNGYIERGTDNTTTIFFGNVENSWQNKNKDIYTRFSAAFGYNNVYNQSQEEQNKVVGQVSFDGRLDRKDYIYGAGVEYNSYSNKSQILDIHASGKHKGTGLAADLTRRTVTSVNDETGEKSVYSKMKLKLNILSNKTDDQPSNGNHFSFESGGSALPSEAEEINNDARNLASEYIKPDRKNGSDLDFEYNENKCGITYEYNHNIVDKDDKFLSVTPVIGVHNYTDETSYNNNESLELTGGIITQFGEISANGQSFTGSITAMTDRIIKRGSHPYDSNYLLASVQYKNSKANLNAELDAGALKSGNINLQYVNLNAEKQMKNSSLGLSFGAAKFKISGDSSNLFNATATYKYTIPYKTKK